jgi:hypothetical protein
MHADGHAAWGIKLHDGDAIIDAAVGIQRRQFIEECNTKLRQRGGSTHQDDQDRSGKSTHELNSY